MPKRSPGIQFSRMEMKTTMPPKKGTRTGSSTYVKQKCERIVIIYECKITEWENGKVKNES